MKIKYSSFTDSIPLAICAHCLTSKSLKIQTMNFSCGEKESVVLKTDFRVREKQTVRCFRRNTPKNQRELNGIEAIYIVLVVDLILTLSFFNYSPFCCNIFFLPSTFSGTHGCTVRTGGFAPQCKKACGH